MHHSVVPNVFVISVLKVDKVLDAMGYAIYLFDIAHVIIDNLQFMLGSEPIGMDRFHAQDQVIF